MSKINKLFAIFLSTLLVTFSANSVEVKFGHVGKPGSLFSASVDHFAKLANKRLTGYKVIAVWENGFRHITNNVRAINSPGDLKGIKLRTPKSKWRVKMFQSYGANPTPMAFSEVFTALKTGTMDGQENPYAQIASAKFQEVQKYLSITGHVYTPAYVTVHKDHWNKLPADVRKILEKSAKDTQKFVYKEAASLEKSLLGVIKGAGVKVNTANKDAFIKASKGIYDQFASEVSTGGSLIKKVSSLAK